MFVNVTHYEQGKVSILSRQGTEFPLTEFQEIVNTIIENVPVGYQLHGELLCVSGESPASYLPREEGNGILNSVAKGGKVPEGISLRFVAWDIVDYDTIVNKTTSSKTYYDRYNRLTTHLQYVVNNSVKVVPTRFVYSKEQALEHYSEMLAQGKEGTVLKSCDFKWKDGTSKEQLKLKLEVDVDLVITGFTQGEGKYSHLFGSVSCETIDGLLKVNVSGMPDKMREYLSEHREESIGKVMCVRGNMLMKPSKSNDKYSIFLPRCVEVREDKVVADSLVQVIEQFDNAIKGEKK